MLQRYATPGYIFAFMLLMLSQPVLDEFKLISSNKLVVVIVFAISGIPIGFLLGQISTFLYHAVPMFCVATKVYNEKWAPLFFLKSVRNEGRLYLNTFEKSESGFNVREWLNQRWSYLIVSYNIVLALIISPLFALFFNYVTKDDPFLFTEILKKHYVIICFFSIGLILINLHNLSKIYFFLVIIYRKMAGLPVLLVEEESIELDLKSLDSDTKIAVVIPTENRVQYLINLLECIKSQTKIPEKVIVIDSSNKDKFIEADDYIMENMGDICCIHQKGNGDTQTKRNIGVEYSNSEIVTFFDDDTEIDKRYLEKIADVFIDNNDIAGVGGLVLSQKQYGITQKTFRPIFGLFSLSANGKSKIKKSGYIECPVNSNEFRESNPRTIEVKALWGCNMSFRREVFNLAKFDPRFDCFQDIEFSLRVSKKAKLVISKDALAIHRRSDENRHSPLKILIRHSAAARQLLAHRLDASITNGLFYYFSVIGVFILIILSIVPNWGKRIVAGAHVDDVSFPENET